MLKNKIIDTIDTAYVEEQGVKEVVEKAPEIMRKVRYIEEKQIVQQFLYEVGHDSGMITYGEAEVRKVLEAGAVRTLAARATVGPGGVSAGSPAVSAGFRKTGN